MRLSKVVVLWSSLTLVGAGPAFAKGLDELSQGNPDSDAAKEEGADGKAGGEGGESAAKAETPMVKSASSKAISDKLFMGTSFGWVKAAKSGGTWQGSGMSDLTIGYKVANLSSVMSLAATYRYAPVAVSGTEDDQSYRGVWESHFFGGKLNYSLGSTLSAVGSAELGYVQVHVKPTDGLVETAKASKGGGQLALGGGADWQMIDKACTVGPRLYLGVGSFTTVQIAGAIGFMF